MLARRSCAISVRSAGGPTVSEKEQAVALKLLSDMLRALKARQGGGRDVGEPEVVARAEKFLALPIDDADPEAHGYRRG